MVNKCDVKKDLDYCNVELEKYQSLSRSGLRDNELKAIDAVMIRLKERIKNLRFMLEN